MLRGLGRQASLMWFNIMGFWAVGFTTGWALTFKAHLGLSGIWLGILSGVSTTGVPPSAVAHHHVYSSCCCSEHNTPLRHLAWYPQWRLHHRCLPLQQLPLIACMFCVAVPRLTQPLWHLACHLQQSPTHAPFKAPMLQQHESTAMVSQQAMSFLCMSHAISRGAYTKVSKVGQCGLPLYSAMPPDDLQQHRWKACL